MKKSISDLVEKYLDTECLHPQLIQNKYTGEKMHVACGHCRVCILNKSRRATALAMNMSTHFKYTHFITLKYDEDHIGKCLVSREGNNTIFTEIPREHTIRSLKFTISQSDSDYKSLMIKVSGRYRASKNRVVYPSDLSQCQNYIPIVDSRDFDLFMKRLRININRKLHSDEQILYYAVSEYGPRTFRPHWHMLLFTDSPLISESLSQLISESWCNGTTDHSLARGYAASYVASYVNSTVCLPLFYTEQKAIKPRSFHSKGYSSAKIFSQPTGVQDVEKIYSYCFDGVSVPTDGQFTTITPSRSYQSVLFPRFSKDILPTPRHAYELVQAVIRAQEWLVRDGCLSIADCDIFSPDFKCKQFSNSLADYLDSILNHYELLRSNFYSNDVVVLLQSLRCFASYTIDIDRFRESVYRLVSKIRRMLNAWHIHFNRPDPIRLILAYNYKLYSDIQLRNLCEYYTYLERCDDLSRKYIEYYTIGRIRDDEESYKIVQKRLNSRAFTALAEKIKHKEYNDLVGLLLT